MNTAENKSIILVVDDIPGNIKTIAASLHDYSVIFATNGEKALELAASKKVDLILLDVVMPEMDGFEVCRRLKQEQKTRDIPVIFVTAKTEEADETHGFELGAVDYITKPISPSIVQARVASQIEIIHSRRKLNEQNHKLIKMAQLKDDVEHIIRHDLKSPINGMISFTEIVLADDDLSIDHRQSITMVKDLAYRTINMINLSLGMVKMEYGTYDLKPEAVDLIPMIRGILSDIGSQIKYKKLEVILTLGETIIPVDKDLTEHQDLPSCKFMGEEVISYSLFANLIKNAVEASTRKQTLTITFSEAAQTSVAIHNMGAVPEQIRDTFFDKYATAGKSTGTGLGTYSAKLIAETQKGSIKMYSSEQDGTTITVTLPNTNPLEINAINSEK